MESCTSRKILHGWEKGRKLSKKICNSKDYKGALRRNLILNYAKKILLGKNMRGDEIRQSHRSFSSAYRHLKKENPKNTLFTRSSSVLVQCSSPNFCIDWAH